MRPPPSFFPYKNGLSCRFHRENTFRSQPGTPALSTLQNARQVDAAATPTTGVNLKIADKSEMELAPSGKTDTM